MKKVILVAVLVIAVFACTVKNIKTGYDNATSETVDVTIKAEDSKNLLDFIKGLGDIVTDFKDEEGTEDVSND